MKNKDYEKYKDIFEKDLEVDCSDDSKFFLLNMDFFEFFGLIKSLISDFKGVAYFHQWSTEIEMMDAYQNEMKKLESNYSQFASKCMEEELIGAEEIIGLKKIVHEALQLQEAVFGYCEHISKKEKETI